MFSCVCSVAIAQNDSIGHVFNSKWNYLFQYVSNLQNGNREIVYKNSMYEFVGSDIISPNNDTIYRQRWFSNGVKTDLLMDTSYRFAEELFFTDSTENIVTKMIFFGNGNISSIITRNKNGKLHGGQFFFRNTGEIEKVLIYTDGVLNGVLPYGVYKGIGVHYYPGSPEEIKEKEKNAAENFINKVLGNNIQTNDTINENEFITAHFIRGYKIRRNKKSEVKLILDGDIKLNGKLIKKGATLSAVIYNEGSSRFYVNIPYLFYNNELINCNINIYDLDKQRGIVANNSNRLNIHKKKYIYLRIK